MKKPDSAVVKITLVPHGYQIDFSIFAGKVEMASGSRCRDYGKNIKVGEAVGKLLGLVHQLDRG